VHPAGFIWTAVHFVGHFLLLDDGNILIIHWLSRNVNLLITLPRLRSGTETKPLRAARIE
jgi:hypothetical protein